MSLKDALQRKLKGLSTGDNLKRLEYLSTGIASLDSATRGGLPLRRVVQIYGPESVGKSSMCLNIIRHVLTKDPEAEALYIDCEATVTKDDIEQMSLPGDRVLFYYPTGGEDAYDSGLDALQAGAKIVVIDSIPFLRPQKVLDEIKKDSTYRDVSAIANLLERVQSKIVHTLQHCNGVLIFINQQRAPKGMYDAPGYPGGMALRYLLSLNINITSSAKDRNDAASMTQKITIRKNKGAAPLTHAEIPCYNRIPLYGADLLGTAENLDIVTKKGAGHYSVSEELALELGLQSPKLGQGQEKVGLMLEQDPKLYDQLYNKVIEEAKKRNVDIDKDEEEAPTLYD